MHALRSVTLERAATLLPASTGLAAALAIGIVRYALWQEPGFWAFVPVVDCAFAALLTGLMLALLLRVRRVRHALENGPAVSWLFALQLGVVLSVAAVLLLIRHVPEEKITGWNFPLMNKYWLLALYNLSVATVLVFPAAFERLRTWDEREPILPVPTQISTRSRTRTIAGALAIAGVCWYFAGPPWNLERHHRVIDWHEQLQLGPMQAMAKGYLPYVGPASMTYGPGAEILLYGGMKLQKHFDVVSFRAGWAAFHLTAVLVVGMAANLWLGFLPALFVIVVGLAYSPLSFYYTLADGTFAGFYGWANPLRYVAPLVIAPTLARILTRESTRTPLILLGVVWGLGAWMAQENLTSTVSAVGLLFLILWITGTVTLKPLIRATCYLVVGFGCVVLPVLLYYALHGATGAFVRAYLLFARATVAGYANEWWPPQDVIPDRFAYYYTLPFVLALGVCGLWRLRPVRLVAPLDINRSQFMALVCVQLACFQTALLRSDASHVLITLIALPFLLVLGFTQLPRFIARSIPGRLAVQVAFVIAAIGVYPALRLRSWRDLIRGPMAKYRATAVQLAPYEGRVAYKRATHLLTNEPELASNSGMTMRQFLDFATELHYLVGDRKTYINDVFVAYPGVLYFMAGLNPAPCPTPLIINDQVRAEVADHIRTHAHEYETFIGPSLNGIEARAFMQGHPGAIIHERMLGQVRLYIVLSKS